MPRRDGTGPMGQGRLTGRGLGNCNASEENQTENAGYYGRGLGQGVGFKRGGGQGLGSGQNAGRGCGRGRKGRGRCCENN